MIVKLQRPLGVGTAGAPSLVYDKGRKRQWLLDLMPDTLDALLGDSPKGYFEADVVDGNVILGKRVADQPW
jgi:hypothetical protein